MNTKNTSLNKAGKQLQSKLAISLGLMLVLSGTAAFAADTMATANSNFAIDLYKQLAKENQGENLFFSPYSIASALAMTVEGARGNTAAEMGKVLRYPDSARQSEDSTRPWRTVQIHSGFQQMNQVLHSDPSDPRNAVTRGKLDMLREELAEAKKATQAAEAAREWGRKREMIAAEEEVAQELNRLAAQVDQFELNVANALWGEESYSIEKPYQETIGKYYETGAIQAADFKRNFEAERLRINGWVEEKTKDRIKDLIPKGALDKYTRLLLVNAIYFKGDWATPFEDRYTKDRVFYLAGGRQVSAKTMYASDLEGGRYGAFNADGTFFQTPERTSRGKKVATYPAQSGFAVAELPYKGKALSMVLIAPLEPNGLGAIEQLLTSEKLNTWLAKLEQREMHVKLPRFKLEAGYTLGDRGEPASLQKMGMVRAFTDPRLPDGADFTGMHDTNVLKERLYISQVLHKAFLDVNEKGTEAAAATAVVMPVPVSLPMSRPFTPSFNADRPFLLMIRHTASGTILFMGRMTNPGA